MFSRVEIQGKCDRNVPVILTPKMKQTISTVLQLRDMAGVAKNNTYVFTSYHHGAKLPYMGSACLKEFAPECGAKNPESLRSTKLRKLP